MIEKRIERLEALEKEQRLFQQAECQQQRQQQLGKRRQPGTQSTSEECALEGRPVSRSWVGAGGRLCCAAARWSRGLGRGCCMCTQPLGACERCLVAEEVVPGWCATCPRLRVPVRAQEAGAFLPVCLGHEALALSEAQVCLGTLRGHFGAQTRPFSTDPLWGPLGPVLWPR